MSDSYHSRLSEVIKERFQITEELECINTGAQKLIFVVRLKNGEKCVIKIPKTEDKTRIEKEIEFYLKYGHLPGIPKLIKYETIGSETVCLEKFIEGDTLCVKK